MVTKENNKTIYLADPFIEMEGVKRCNYDNECDFCAVPQKGSYVKPSGNYEHPDECDYCICGKCIIENQTRNQGKFNDFDLPEIRLPF